MVKLLVHESTQVKPSHLQIYDHTEFDKVTNLLHQYRNIFFQTDKIDFRTRASGPSAPRCMQKSSIFRAGWHTRTQALKPALCGNKKSQKNKNPKIQTLAGRPVTRYPSPLPPPGPSSLRSSSSISRLSSLQGRRPPLDQCAGGPSPPDPRGGRAVATGSVQGDGRGLLEPLPKPSTT